jgi:hypothetical protein
MFLFTQQVIQICSFKPNNLKQGYPHLIFIILLNFLIDFDFLIIVNLFMKLFLIMIFSIIFYLIHLIVWSLNSYFFYIFYTYLEELIH